MKQKPIAVVLLLDVEPDERQPQPGAPVAWSGAEALFPLIADWRAQSPLTKPPQLNWFWRNDEQLQVLHGAFDWSLKHFAREIDAANAQGDSHGLHPHAWRWDQGSWLVDQGNWPFLEAMIRQAFDTHCAYFGEKPKSFRFGDEWVSDALFDLEEELGLVFDTGLVVDQPATAALKLTERFTGTIPERMKVPHLPHRRPGRRLWFLPCSSGSLNPPAPQRHWLHRLVQSKPTETAPQVVANLAFAPRSFRHIFDNALAKTKHRFVQLCLRSDAASHPVMRPYLIKNLQMLDQHPLAKRFRFVRPEQALEILGLD